MKVTEDAVSLQFTWLIKADHFSPKVGQIYIEGITWPRAAREDTNFILFNFILSAESTSHE